MMPPGLEPSCKSAAVARSQGSGSVRSQNLLSLPAPGPMSTFLSTTSSSKNLCRGAFRPELPSPPGSKRCRALAATGWGQGHNGDLEVDHPQFHPAPCRVRDYSISHSKPSIPYATPSPCWVGLLHCKKFLPRSSRCRSAAGWGVGPSCPSEQGLKMSGSEPLLGGRDIQKADHSCPIHWPSPPQV